MEKQWVLPIPSVCICSLRYPAWNAHAPYCHLGPLQFYYIFPRYLINSTIFGKQLLNIKCVFFSLQLLSEAYLIRRRKEQDMIKNVHGVHAKYPLFWHDLMKPQFSCQILKICWNIKFHENPSSGSRVFPCRQMDRQRHTDRHKEEDNHFSQFCNTPKNYVNEIIQVAATEQSYNLHIKNMQIKMISLKLFIP